MKIAELHKSITGDIMSTDGLYFYIQYDSLDGSMNFDVKRTSEGKTNWFVPQHENDIEPSYYNEDGFLSNVGKYLKEVIIPTKNSLFCLPSISDLIGDNKFEIFNPLIPQTDSNYNDVISFENYAIVGQAIVGESVVADLGYRIRVKNNYSGVQPFNMVYKVSSAYSNTHKVYIYLDGTNIIQTNIVSNDTEYTINLSSIWNSLDYEQHKITIVLIENDIKITKEIIFKKALNLVCSYNNTNHSYYTDSIDTIETNKLCVINEMGNKSVSYPNQTIGNRYVVNLPISTLVSKNKQNNYHIITSDINSKMQLVNIGTLQLGEKVKDFETNYNDEPIEFTVINKTGVYVSLITDILCIKEYDASETILTNGDVDWSLSNLKQWLNNNDKLVRD